jgi:hypothetical protein
MAKNKVQVERPLRDPDHVSKRGVFYWWSPEWTRGTSSSNATFGKIKAIREPSCHGAYEGHTGKCKCKDTANLYMVSKDGNETYIQGSIQEEFKQWHDDRQIDYILLGESPESATDLIITETEDTKYEP